jgi:hypothetical protein
MELFVELKQKKNDFTDEVKPLPKQGLSTPQLLRFKN